MTDHSPQLPPPPQLMPLPTGLYGWGMFVGIVTLLEGALQVFTCIGMIGGILTIIAGAGLIGASSALQSSPAVDAAMYPFFTKLKTFLVFTGIAYIIGFILLVGVLIVYFGAIAAALSNASRHW